MTWICGGKSMQGRRRVQEDKYIIIEDFNAFSVKTLEKPNVCLPNHLMPAILLGVFDGHMGILASKFCAKQLPIELVKELETLFLPDTSSVAENTIQQVISDESEIKCSERISNSTENNPQPNTIPSITFTSTLKKDSTSLSLVKRARECGDNAGNGSKKSKYLSQDVQAPSIVDGENELKQVMTHNCLSFIKENMEDAHVSHMHEKTHELDLKFFHSSITKAFRRTDDLFLQKHRLSKDGSTASIVLLLGQHVFTAWLGDSRVILASKRSIRFREMSSNDKIECPLIDKEYDQQAEHNDSSHSHGTQWISSALSNDHKPSRIDEQKRIINAGGQILQTSGVFRVARGDFQAECRRIKKINCLYHGGASSQHPPVALAVSRAMGDRDFKINLQEFLIISDPEIRYFQFKKKVDIALLIACDGIWDVLTNQEVVSLLQTHVNNDDFTQFEAGASSVVKAAFQKGSQDNLTLVYAYAFPSSNKLTNEESN